MKITLQEAFVKFAEITKGKGNYAVEVIINNFDPSFPNGKVNWRLYLDAYKTDDLNLGPFNVTSTTFESALFNFIKEMEKKKVESETKPEEEIQIEQKL